MQKMKCKEVHKNLIFYIDKDLTSAKSKEIEQHLSICKKCSNLYNEIKSTMSVVENEKNIETNPFLYTRIKQKLEDINKNKTNPIFAIQKRRLLQTALVTFTIAIGFFIGISIGNSLPVKNNNIANNQSEQYYIND